MDNRDGPYHLPPWDEIGTVLKSRDTFFIAGRQSGLLSRPVGSAPRQKMFGTTKSQERVGPRVSRVSSRRRRDHVTFTVTIIAILSASSRRVSRFVVAHVAISTLNDEVPCSPWHRATGENSSGFVFDGQTHVFGLLQFLFYFNVFAIPEQRDNAIQYLTWLCGMLPGGIRCELSSC